MSDELTILQAPDVTLYDCMDMLREISDRLAVLESFAGEIKAVFAALEQSPIMKMLPKSLRP